MDAERLKLVEAVRDGHIRDLDRALTILRDARAVQESECARVYAEYSAVQDAEQAVLKGWPTPIID